jgi:hypothetical protein
MAGVEIQVAGAAIVKVGTGSSDALETLGYTANGVDTRTQAYMGDVPGDENGGEAGPPIDVQYFGETAHIRCELTKYDSAIADKVGARVKGGTAGTYLPSAVGTLMFGASKHTRVLIHTANGPQNFPRCICREPIEVNKGTRYSRLILEFTAYKDPTSGLLYNSTAT